MSETPTGTDRVELTDDEREGLTSCCNRSDCQGTFAAVESIITGRLAASTAELDDHRTLHADMVDQAKVMDEHIIRAEAEIEELQAQGDAHWRDLLGLKAERNAARAELAAANARCAELEAERAEYEPRLRELTASLIEARAETAAFRKSNEDWRDTAGEAIGEQEAAQREARSWESNYNTLKAENARLRGRITEGLVCQTCKTDFAERDALQATLDRVGAFIETWSQPHSCAKNNTAQCVPCRMLRDLRAALTPEGKREGEKAMPDKTEGLIHNKFYVQRTDNETNRKHDDCRYFVLDPQHDRLALFALATYAHEALDAGYTALGNDLIAWVRQIEDAETLEGKP